MNNSMTVQEHLRACILWMDNDERLYTRGVAIQTVFRKTGDQKELDRLINDYAKDIVATTNLNESGHPHMAVDGTQDEVTALIVERIKEVFAENDKEFAPLDQAIKDAK